MDYKSLNYEEQDNMVKYLAKIYRQATTRTECNYLSGRISESNDELKNDLTLVHMIDSSLNDCGRDTRIIIKSGYLTNNDDKWYLDYYTKSTYYRLKKKAVSEFLDCLNVY